MEVAAEAVGEGGTAMETEEMERRKALSAQFAAITGCSAAAACEALGGHDWHLERALNAYFEQPLEDKDEGGREPPPRMDPGGCIDLTADATTSNVSDAGADSGQQDDDSSFSLITWNIDGLDSRNLQERARGVCSYLALYSPDVVFLQEVILPYLCILQSRVASYTVIPGNIDGYFTVILLKKSRVKLLKQEIVGFPTTSMMRNLLVVHVSISGNELCLMTSHLESTKDHSKERVKQLQIVLNKMQEESESTTVIFGGDTNLRDSERVNANKIIEEGALVKGFGIRKFILRHGYTQDEKPCLAADLKSENCTLLVKVTKLGGLPNNVMDMWEFLGKPQHCRYTWDTSSNTNLGIANKCKLRFDRVYIRPAAEGGNIVPRSMDLIGLEKLDCGRFPSDHWGLLCNFDVIL